MTAAATARRSAFPAWLTGGRALQLLLVFVPITVIAEWRHASALYVFGFAALSIIPLAGLMGEATEELAARLGAGLGGLLNATFGNAAELIIALAAIQHGYYDVVKASLTGSILGNLLLVLGLSIFVGGLGREHQKFDRSAAAAGTTLMALAVVGLLVPALFHSVARHAVTGDVLTAAREIELETNLSFRIAGVLFIAYLASLLFSLRTHRHLYAGHGHDEHAPAAAKGVPMRAVVHLLIATAFIAWMSEILVGVVEEASHTLGLTEVFVGVIVVAVIGNAAEHSTAVIAARKNQMDLALSIAVGSSLQIALFVAPLLVFVSAFMPHGVMDLRFSLFEVVAVGLAVWVVSLVAHDGESNWLEGALLLAVYLILGLAFFFLPRGTA